MYYAVSNRNEATYSVINTFDNLESAIKFANKNKFDHISEIGGCWNDFHPCDVCGGWFTYDELNNDLICDRCQQTIDTH